MTRCHPALASSINWPDSSFAVETVVSNLHQPHSEEAGCSFG